MGSRARFAVLPFILVASIARGAGAAPTAADKETARTLMDEGRALRDQRDLKGALDRFSRANAIMHVPTTGYEVATTQVALGLLVEARDTLAAIRETPVAPREPRPFQEARKHAAALDDALVSRIPALNITVQGAPDGTAPTVTVDDVPVPPAALGVPRAVDPGHHVVVGKAGELEARQDVDVSEGQKKDVPLTLALAPPAPVEVAPAPEPVHSPQNESHTLLYASLATGGVGVAALVTGIATGIATLSKKSSLDSTCGPSHDCPPSAFSALDSAHSMATVSTVTFIAGGILTAAGATGFVLLRRKKQADDAPAPASAPDATAWIGPGSVGIAGHF